MNAESSSRSQPVSGNEAVSSTPYVGIDDAPGFLTCPVGIRPRPLAYSLTDYHRAPGDGPLHYQWQDKPHRLLYDLIAALAYYAEQDRLARAALSAARGEARS